MDEMSEGMRAAFAAIDIDPDDRASGNQRIARAIPARSIALYTTLSPSTGTRGVGLFLPVGDADVRVNLTNEQARELASHLMDAALHNITVTHPARAETGPIDIAPYVRKG